MPCRLHPGSGEASLVDQIVKGTGGQSDEHITYYLRGRRASIGCSWPAARQIGLGRLDFAQLAGERFGVVVDHHAE